MSARPSILVIDDDKRLRELLRQYLKGEGFAIKTAESAKSAAKKLAKNHFDLLVVDVMMPGQTGVEFTAELRKTSDVPVLMLTAMGEVEDRIKGLEAGADDYLAKPFEPKELCLRINSILGRSGVKKQPKRVRFGEFVFNHENGELFKNDKFINLTSTELRLLGIFTENMNEPISREELARRLNGISERSVDVQVTRLRRKIEKDPRNPLHLETYWGSGYVLRDKGAGVKGRKSET